MKKMTENNQNNINDNNIKSNQNIKNSIVVSKFGNILIMKMIMEKMKQIFLLTILIIIAISILLIILIIIIF